MSRRLAALIAAIALLVTAVTPSIAQVGQTAPAAASDRVAAAPSSPVDQTKVPHYFGPYPNWANSPLTLPDAQVVITPAGGGGPGTPVTVGNFPPIPRQYPSDDTLNTGTGTVGQGTVLVVLPTALPAGTLTDFQTYTQNATLPVLGSPGNTFNAYVLHPTGALDEYSIVFDSGPLTVPAEGDGVHTWLVASDMPAQAGSTTVALGDVIAFYGQGIPLDTSILTDDVFYIAAAAPTGTFTVNSVAFPNLGSKRAYSFAATIAPPGGPASGSGAKAEATVGANGAVTGLTITNPGSGYAAADVLITDTAGTNTTATASADVQTSGAVTNVDVDQAGGGYTAPTVAFANGGAATQATGSAFGGVDPSSPSARRARATVPDVDFDLPDDPAGVQAQGHATCAAPYPDCNLAVGMDLLTVTDVVVDSAGSGYATAPGVVIHDGTLFDPINPAPIPSPRHRRPRP